MGGYAQRVREEEFTYPPYETPLAQAYGGLFEAAFIVLHPFIEMPAEFAWQVRPDYPSDAEILTYGSPCGWTEVERQAGLSSCARINQALLTATGSLTGDLADIAGRELLRGFLQQESVWMPSQGRFEPLLQRKFLRVFANAGWRELVFVPEFPQASPVVRLEIDGLLDGSIPFPGCGTLLGPDHSFLFTVDWDSFFTLFYGAREFVRRMAQEQRLEGFFATANTDHAWFNYSMGCATVTLSPEHWQTEQSSAK